VGYLDLSPQDHASVFVFDAYRFGLGVHE
jgi:hypothetical protein